MPTLIEQLRAARSELDDLRCTYCDNIQPGWVCDVCGKVKPEHVSAFYPCRKTKRMHDIGWVCNKKKGHSGHHRWVTVVPGDLGYIALEHTNIHIPQVCSARNTEGLRCTLRSGHFGDHVPHPYPRAHWPNAADHVE